MLPLSIETAQAVAQEPITWGSVALAFAALLVAWLKERRANRRTRR